MSQPSRLNPAAAAVNADAAGHNHDGDREYGDAIDYLFGRIDYERRTAAQQDAHEFRLDRTAELFRALGLGHYLAPPWNTSSVTTRPNVDLPPGVPQSSESPPPRVPLIHIAGTKGKGSTANMVSSILSSAGYRVGMYTSPHLTRLEERFRINGDPCSPRSLVGLVESVSAVVDRFDASDAPVSFFELTTAMAIRYFDVSRCDAIVLEVGLGGRLDSTNVCASTVTAVTSIGLDHQRVLGDTLGQIAREKAGIIKPGVPVVSGVTHAEARDVIRSVASEQGSPMFEIGDSFCITEQRAAKVGSHFVYESRCEQLGGEDGRDKLPVFLSPDGVHQTANAGIAISLVRLLREPVSSVARSRVSPLTASDSEIASGLRQVRLNGRIERFTVASPSTDRSVQLVLDTAHNQDSVAALCDTIKRHCHELSPQRHEDPAPDTAHDLQRPIVFVFGTSSDKDADRMADEIGPIADHVVCTQYTTNPRAFPATTLYERFSEFGLRQASCTVAVETCPRAAVRAALRCAGDGGTVIICGSFFLVGELRPHLIDSPDIHPLRPETASAKGRPNGGTSSGASPSASIDMESASRGGLA